MSPYLREDTDFYCAIWLGVAVLGAFYFNFVYMLLMDIITLSSIFTTLAPILGLPLVLAFFFYGYLHPAHGKTKYAMGFLSVVTAFFYFLQANLLPADLGGGLQLAVWGIGGAFLTGMGFSIMPPLEESMSPGRLDLSALPYGKRPEPKTETAVDNQAEDEKTSDAES